MNIQRVLLSAIVLMSAGGVINGATQRTGRSTTAPPQSVGHQQCLVRRRRGSHEIFRARR